jgi:cytidyltransferase-like protein
MKKTAIFVGRFNPMHLGHTRTVDAMLKEFGEEKSLLILGSCNAAFSLRHFFSYDERKKFIKMLYPNVKVIGLPDYGDDGVWLSALDDIIRATGYEPSDVIFFGGCEEDVRFFIEDGRECRIINRFDESLKKISATEVRDALITGKALDGLVDPRLAPELSATFSKKWEQFKKI